MKDLQIFVWSLFVLIVLIVITMLVSINTEHKMLKIQRKLDSLEYRQMTDKEYIPTTKTNLNH